MEQAIEIVGALLVLAAYALMLAGRLTTASAAYLALNVAGGAILATVAALGANWGFLLLQGVWAIVAGWSLVRRPDREAG